MNNLFFFYCVKIFLRIRVFLYKRFWNNSGYSRESIFIELQDYFFPEFFSLQELSWRRNEYRNARAFSEHVIVPTEFIREAMYLFLKFPKEIFFTIPLLIEPLSYYKRQPLEVSADSFILYPAENDLLKNHERLFQAVAKLIQQGWQGYLVCVGAIKKSAAPLASLIQDLGIKNHVILLERVTKEELSWLYHRARCCVLPGLFEGFSQSMISAFEAGLPVLCSGLSCFPELGGDAVLYCNPFDAGDIAKKILLLWHDPALRKRLSIQGKKRHSLFSARTVFWKQLMLFVRVIQKTVRRSKVNRPVAPMPDVDPSLTEIFYRQKASLQIAPQLPSRSQWFSAPFLQTMTHCDGGWSLRRIPPVQKEMFIPKLLPTVHFMTIVYNGMPFIKRHLDIFSKLPFSWHWHIVEGAAKLVGDTSWSVSQGGKLPEKTSILSKDGTKEYLDGIASMHSDCISLYRKEGFWEGKLEMISAPLKHLPDQALLWEIDVDEFWTEDQIIAMVVQFFKEPTRTGACFYSRFFVGPHRIADNLGSYGNNPASEWRRLWKYHTGDFWSSHEPPILMRHEGKALRDVLTIYPFTHDETWKMGLVFDHLAYVTKEQIQFKEAYYGYQGATAAFEKMLQENKDEFLIKDYYFWVKEPIWAFKI